MSNVGSSRRQRAFRDRLRFFSSSSLLHYNSSIEITIGDRSISPSGPSSAAFTNNVSGVW